jgi:hypothetical protein
VLDAGDPNYDSGEEPYKLRTSRGTALPRADVIVAYKSLITKMTEEFFESSDVHEGTRGVLSQSPPPCVPVQY